MQNCFFKKKKKLASIACSDFYVLSHFPATLPLFFSVIRLIVISSGLGICHFVYLFCTMHINGTA